MQQGCCGYGFGQIGGVVDLVANEFTVDLDEVDGQVLQMMERANPAVNVTGRERVAER